MITGIKYLKVHRKVQEIMYADMAVFRERIDLLQSINIEFNVIDDSNFYKYRPSDGFFNIEKLYRGKNKYFLAATLNGKPVAFAGIIFKGGYSMYFKVKKSDAYFEGLYTFPEYRGMGIMSNLIAELYNRVSYERDISLLSLCVRPDNINAKRLYEKFGFRSVKTVHFWMKCNIKFPHYLV